MRSPGFASIAVPSTVTLEVATLLQIPLEVFRATPIVCGVELKIYIWAAAQHRPTKLNGVVLAPVAVDEAPHFSGGIFVAQ